MARGVSLADEFASKSKLNPLLSQSSDLEPLAGSNRYKAPDLTSGDNVFDLMQFVMKEANRILASGDGGEVSAFQTVNAAIVAIKEREAQRKGKDKGSSFHQLMLLQRLSEIYQQIRIINERLDILKNVIQETKELLDTIDEKSFDEARETAYGTLTKAGLDADKILANAQDKNDIRQIMREFDAENKQEQEGLARKRKQLEQEAHDVVEELGPTFEDPDLTENQKNAKIQTTLDKRDWETVLKVEQVSKFPQLEKQSATVAKEKIADANKALDNQFDEDAFFSSDQNDVSNLPGPKT